MKDKENLDGTQMTIAMFSKALSALDPDRLTKQEIEEFLTKITEHVKGVGTKNEQTLEAMINAVNNAISNLAQKHDLSASDIRKEVMSQLEEQMNKMRFDHEAMMAEMKIMMDDKESMEEEHDQEMMNKMMEMIPAIPELKPETSVSVRDKLENLGGDERLDVSAIKGLDEELKKITDIASTKSSGGGRTWGGTGFYDLSAQTNGTLKVFSVPKGLAGVAFSSDFPMVLMEGRGFSINANRTEITLTTTEAPSLNSQLLYQYTRIFS